MDLDGNLYVQRKKTGNNGTTSRMYLVNPTGSPTLVSDNYTGTNLNAATFFVDNGYEYAIYAKGLWETISKLRHSGLQIVQLGGGVNEKHKEHARKNNVELKALPRVSQATMRALMRNAKAMVSNAINEPFGLTPPEAYFVDCPVIVSNQGGFRETVVDGQTGRLMSEGDDWISAIDQGHKHRKEWSKAGRDHIKKINLTPEAQAKKVFETFSQYFEEE